MPRETVPLSGNLGERQGVVGFIVRFWSKVDRKEPNECWIWKGSFKENGYPQLGVGSITNGTRTMRMAHRLSWLIHFGEVPAGKFVLHHCDTPACVNPNHLYLGTNTDNMGDAARRDRIAHGVRHTYAKLNPEKVRRVRAMFKAGTNCNQIAEKMGVTSATIQQVIEGQTWRRVI